MLVPAEVTPEEVTPAEAIPEADIAEADIADFPAAPAREFHQERIAAVPTVAAVVTVVAEAIVEPDPEDIRAEDITAVMSADIIMADTITAGDITEVITVIIIQDMRLMERPSVSFSGE
jgi:uncharacterized membrane protein